MYIRVCENIFLFSLVYQVVSIKNRTCSATNEGYNRNYYIHSCMCEYLYIEFSILTSRLRNRICSATNEAYSSVIIGIVCCDKVLGKL